jgi:hypothetical protein
LDSQNSRLSGINGRLNLAELKRLIILILSKTSKMKRILAFVALIAFLSACSQYTCPTYSKKEVKKSTAENRI